MPDEVVIIMGINAAGKTTHTQSFIDQGYVRVNRDEIGGKLSDIHQHLDKALSGGAKKAVLDNTFAEASSRKEVIQVAKKHGLPIRCVWLDTSLEDAQVNACFRMTDWRGKVFQHTSDFKGINNPNIFPVAALYSYRKRFEKPTTDEGFEKIEKVKFVRKHRAGTAKAVVLDFDDTVRRLKEGSGFQHKYPTDASHIEIMPGRKEVLDRYVKDGYILLGASNQSGIAKGHLTEQQCRDLFAHTCKLLGHDIDVRFCPHNVPPISCYCRKPGPGMLVQLIYDYDLDPLQCIFVGDQTTDENAAKKVSFQYQDQSVFFK